MRAVVLRSPFSVLGFPVLFSVLLSSPGRGEDPNKDLAFWDSPARAHAAAAAQLITAPGPYAMLALRLHGKRMLVWNEPEFLGPDAPPLNPEWLASAAQRDRRPMPDFRGRSPEEIPKANKDFYDLYCQALVNAFQTPLDAFVHSARENSHVTFAHLYNEPGRYRGQVIPIQGQLARLRKYDAPLAAQKKGVRWVYEGWIFTTTPRSHPVVVLCPLVPDGLQPAETMDRWVKFYGYLLNLYRYTSGRGERDTLLLVGPSVILAQAPPAAEREDAIPRGLLYGLVGFVGVVAMAVLALNWWFRRGDRRVQSRVAAIQSERTREMLQEAEKPPEEPTPPGTPPWDRGFHSPSSG